MTNKAQLMFIFICATFCFLIVFDFVSHQELFSCKCEKKQGPHSDEVKSTTDVIETKKVDFSHIMYMEPLVKEDFPTVSSTHPRIPHIFHQTYKNTNIPILFTKYVRTITTKNRHWTYYFWTDISSRLFVAEKFPALLRMWDDYRNPINRADAIRYLVLYEFGGMYADLDVSVKRNLDKITMKYACIFPTEPFEQSVFRLRLPYLMSNAIMLCRPKHPFLKQMVETLHQFKPMVEQLDVAGPSFVTSQFIRYNNIYVEYVYKLKQTNESNSPYFYKGELPEEHENAVYVPNTQYFINSLSTAWMNEQTYKAICAKSGPKSIFEKKACNELTRRLAQKDRARFAFTDHHWTQSYFEKGKLMRISNPLKELVGNFTIY